MIQFEQVLQKNSEMKRENVKPFSMNCKQLSELGTSQSCCVIHWKAAKSKVASSKDQFNLLVVFTIFFPIRLLNIHLLFIVCVFSSIIWKVDETEING